MDCILPTMLVYITLLVAFRSQTAAKLTMKPSDTDVKVNQTTYLNCSTDFGSRAAFWYHGTKYVYTGFAILEPYNKRFQVDRIVWNGTYIYNLIIHSVQPNDAGIYKCAEDEGFGEEYSVQLIVLDDDPICRSNVELDEVIGQNSCNIEPDEVELECSVTFHGNIPPQLEWKKVGGNSSIPLDVSVVSFGNHFVSTLKFKGDIALNNFSYVCETKRSTQEPIKCTSNVIRILYALSYSSVENKTIDDEIRCKANTSQSCRYQWKFLQDNDFTIESSTSVLNAKKTGWHRCEAECYLRNRSCNLLVMRALIYGETGYNKLRTTIIYVLVGVFVTLGVGAALTFVFCRIAKKKKKQATKNRDDSDNQLRQQFETFKEDHGVLPDEVNEDEIDIHHMITRKPEEIALRGVAILNENLFVAPEKDSTLSIYNCGNLQESKLLRVEGLVYTMDMCSCNINACLYILYEKYRNSGRDILRINSDGEVLKKWPTKKGFSLSARVDGNVIVTVYFEHLLLEYSPNGDLLREINLSSCYPNPEYAIEVNNGRYIVSHNDYLKSGHRLCLVDEVGNVEKSFGREIGSTKYQVNWPYYFAAGNSGYVIVADACNNRLLLFDSNLEFKTKIVPKYKQKWLSPYTLCLSETLLVVLIERGDPNNSTKADNFRKETEEGDTSTNNNDMLLEKDDMIEIEDGDTSIENNEMLIEEDCRLLVVDIKQLLQKYFG